MNYNQQCAAKDFLREAYCIIDDLVYATSRAEKTDNISINFICHAEAVCRAAISISESFSCYSESEDIKVMARNIKDMSGQWIRNMRGARRHCGRAPSPSSDCETYMLDAERISERLFEEMRCCHVSERINWDYLKIMICLAEGMIRLSENALCYGLSSYLRPIASEMAAYSRKAVAAMKKSLITPI